MSRRDLPWLLVPLGLVLLGAGPVADPVDWLRRGDAAFGRGDYSEALEAYEQAEDRADEPGLVAFNKAVTLYHLERFGEAEACYRECLEDAQDRRRSAALFGLGNCLVQESRGIAGPLREAIRCFRECLQEDSLDPLLAEDSRHNLELAKLLLLDAREAPDDRSRPPRDSEDGQNHPKPPTRPDDPNAGRDGSGMNRFDQGKGQAGRAPGQEGAAGDQQAAAGAGNLPPIPDEGDLVPVAPEVAAAQLKQAADRVRQARGPALLVEKKPAGVLDR